MPNASKETGLPTFINFMDKKKTDQRISKICSQIEEKNSRLESLAVEVETCQAEMSALCEALELAKTPPKVPIASGYKPMELVNALHLEDRTQEDWKANLGFAQRAFERAKDYRSKLLEEAEAVENELRQLLSEKEWIEYFEKFAHEGEDRAETKERLQAEKLRVLKALRVYNSAAKQLADVINQNPGLVIAASKIEGLAGVSREEPDPVLEIKTLSEPKEELLLVALSDSDQGYLRVSDKPQDNHMLGWFLVEKHGHSDFPSLLGDRLEFIPPLTS